MTSLQSPASASESLVETLRATLDTVLRPLVPTDQPVALLDFPVHGNCGDSAIWLGGRSTLRRLGVSSIAYTCSIRTFSPYDLARRIGHGTIFLSGGGNLGDIYLPHQELREKVIASCPANPIVQLPQSIYFESQAAIKKARPILEGHPQFTLLIRDLCSLAIARREFPGVRSILCPDIALGLGPLRPTREPSHRVLWLSRTDRESLRRNNLGVAPPGVLRMDWITWRDPNRGIVQRVWRRALNEPRLIQLLNPVLARRNLYRGIGILSAGRWVITDRLHGHLFALLLGIPHCLLPNSNGKIRAFYETWTQKSPLAIWCENEAQALQIALDSSPEASR